MGNAAHPSCSTLTELCRSHGRSLSGVPGSFHMTGSASRYWLPPPVSGFEGLSPIPLSSHARYAEYVTPDIVTSACYVRRKAPAAGATQRGPVQAVLRLATGRG